jgi:DNA-binding IclR family transcriptional regulator
LIEKITPPGVGRTATWVGKQLALHCTALGKSLAAHLDDAEVEKMISEQGLMRYNDNTICSLRRFKQELETVRQRGYALDDEEEEIGIRCIGTGISTADGESLAALSVVGTTVQICGDSFPRLVNQVTGAAKGIANRVRNANLPYTGGWINDAAAAGRHAQ